MQVIYEDSVLSKIYSTVEDARGSGRKIKKISLSTNEMDELCVELGGQRAGKFDYRILPLEGFLVVETMDI